MHSSRKIIAILAALLVLPAPAAAHAEAPTEVVSVRIVNPVVDTTGGWAYPELEVHYRDPDGLPDRLGEPVATALGGTAKEPGELVFPRLDRVSGTATDGVWRGTVRVSSAWAGTYTVNQMVPVGTVTNGPTVTVNADDRWVVSATRQTLRVVTGRELWRPQARITRVDGSPVAGGRIVPGGFQAALPATPAPGAPADANGVWTSPVRFAIADSWRDFLPAFGGRGSRGWSLQGVTCADPTIKLQASSTYPATPVASGAALTVTGNVWPAPVILGPDLPTGLLQLQRQSPAGWVTVATATARDSGRYTLTWQSPPSGTHSMRVRWPGAGSPAECELHSIGTTLATSVVTVR